jgi:hypothetical protein
MNKEERGMIRKGKERRRKKRKKKENRKGYIYFLLNS